MTAETKTPPPLTSAERRLAAPGGTEELVAEYWALAGRFPPPDAKAQWADVAWISEHISTPAFDPYRGRYVAVMDRAVRGTGETQLAAEVNTARGLGVHPARLIVVYVDPSSD
jgi:hypothetical protein